MIKYYLLFTVIMITSLSISAQRKANGEPVVSGLGKNVGNKDLDLVCQISRQLLLSDIPYATERSFQLTDDITYTTDGIGYYKSLTAEGNWEDIDYQSKSRASWLPSWHLYRLLLVQRAYNRNHNAKYLDAVHSGLKYWIKNDYQCSNWWHNQINIPYAYSSILLTLGKDVQPDELNYLNTILSKRADQKKATGQNKIWQHDIEARIALINRDETQFSKAIKDMQSVIKISSDEGIQYDYSFHQHGPMLQFGNYGMHFVNSLLFWLKVTTNTPWAFDKEKQKILFDYCSNGLRWTIFKGKMDVPAVGRQLRADYAAKRGINLFDDFNLVQSLDPGNLCKYNLDGLSKDNKLVCMLDGNKSFWRSDYMLSLNNNKYMMSVKTHGPFVNKVESINSENLKGSFLNDGVSLIQCSGKEYANIEPLWNWTMLPGTTCDTTLDAGSKTVFASKNNSDFVGQVSDGKCGISSMYYDRLGLRAYKSYFFIQGMQIALGAAITSGDINNVVTTIDQRYYDQSFRGSADKGKPWFWQDGTGYFSVDTGEHIKTKIELRKGNWQAIDEASGNKPVSGKLLTLYFDHSKKSTYSYLIKPDISLDAAMKLAKNLPAKILSNTENIQAIEYGSTIMIAFYKPGELNIPGKKIQVDLPCLIIYKITEGKDEVWIADPGRKAKTIRINLNRTEILATLPEAGFAGSSVQVL